MGKQKDRENIRLHIKDLTYYYPHSDSPSIKDVNLNIEPGEFILLVGPSGCGKTTLVRCLNRLIPEVAGGDLQGNIVLNGKDTGGKKVNQIALHVGMVFQNPGTQLFSLTVGEDVAFGPENLGLDKQDILKRVDSSLKAVRMEDLQDHFIFTLSGGEKQRTAIGGNLAMEPDILVLDEPTSDLDPVGTKEVLDIIKRLNREKNMTIILIEHKIDEVIKLADRMIVMENGRISLDGNPCNIFEQEHDHLKRNGIYPPQITEVSHVLRTKYGLKAPSTYEPMLEFLTGLLKDSSCSSSIENDIVPPATIPHVVIEKMWHDHEDGSSGLKDINLQVNHGEFVALIGHNGAGKTILSNHLIGLLKPCRGRILIDGKDISNLSTAELAQRVGYLFQNPDDQIFTDNVMEEIRFGLKNVGVSKDEMDKRVKAALEMMELEGYGNRHPHSLSRGQRQRLAVASILAMEPDLLVLDEPTTGQDRGHVNKFLHQIKELNNLGKTVILITHDMNIAAEYADRTIVMKKGEIFLNGSTRDVFSMTEELQETCIESPVITRLSLDLRKKGIDVPVMLTVDEFKRYLETNDVAL
ncbi:MAG: ATP-binding cassette domain-containing protein [Methanosarcinaceae archaeon]|nr:ATP-binding cassette domain-containing protein [Methanosarcinaceae archaeon]